MTTRTTGLPLPPGGARPSIVQLAIKEKAALYAAYIPLFKEGGVFLPSTRDYRLGDDVYILLTLPDDIQRYPIAGKIGWITPAQAAGNRPQGVGVRFSTDDACRSLKAKIESILGSQASAGHPTQTL